MELMELVFRRRKLVPLAGEQWDVKVELRIEQQQKTTKGQRIPVPRAVCIPGSNPRKYTVKMNKEMLNTI